jgi:hypothetical protein
MAAIILMKDQNIYWNLSKHLNVISFTPTADTVNVQVPVGRWEGKNKTPLI